MSDFPNRTGTILLRALVIVAALGVCSFAVSLLPGPQVERPHPVVPQLGPGEKMVGGGGGSMFDAVAISNVTVAGSPINNLKPFLAPDDWVQTMTISLKNRTNKTVVYVYVLLGFPEAGDGRTEPYAAYRIRLGRIPALDAYTRSGRSFYDPNRKPLSFGPGQTLEIHVGDYIDRIRQVVEKKMYLTMVTKCVIDLSDAYFEDGMCWNGGSGFGVADPDHVGRFKYFERHYFPGDRTQNWPPWH
jgi:hypothetical protein